MLFSNEGMMISTPSLPVITVGSFPSHFSKYSKYWTNSKTTFKSSSVCSASYSITYLVFSKVVVTVVIVLLVSSFVTLTPTLG